MVMASNDVLRRPAVATFEAHKRNTLAWATVYVTLGAVITALLGTVGYIVQSPFLEGQFAELSQQLEGIQSALGQPGPIEAFIVPQDPISAILEGFIETFVGFFLYVGVVYALGWLLGGRGAFGELAYDLSLIWVPFSSASALVNIFSIGILACVTVPVNLALGLYLLYLTFLGIRSGMNLSVGRALVVIVIPVLLLLVFVCGLVAIIVAVNAAQNGG
jgi:hypothetical protein